MATAVSWVTLIGMILTAVTLVAKIASDTAKDTRAKRAEDEAKVTKRVTDRAEDVVRERYAREDAARAELVDNLIKKIEQLTRRLGTVEGENSDLTRRVAFLEEENATLRKRIGELEAENKTLREEIGRLVQQLAQSVKA